VLLLADTSAWHRAGRPEIAPRWQDRLRGGQIATTEPVRLELLYSAQSAEAHDRLAARLLAIPQLPVTSQAFGRALQVQSLLAHLRPLHHRLPVTDLIIAAVAELAGAIVWHYDSDFDRIAEVTGQRTEWIAPRGSL
jgi:predicted nucleic acid-binding protein